MTKQNLIKVHVEVGADHTIRLPDEVPVGPAEVIVLSHVAMIGSAPPEALGLFNDSPDLVDQVIAHVSEMRSRSRLRPAK